MKYIDLFLKIVAVCLVGLIYVTYVKNAKKGTYIPIHIGDGYMTVTNSETGRVYYLGDNGLYYNSIDDVDRPKKGTKLPRE